MPKELIGIFDVGDVPGDDASDEEVEMWAEVMTNALFDSPRIKKISKEALVRGRRNERM